MNSNKILIFEGCLFWGGGVWGFCFGFFFFLKGAESEPCGLMYSVQVMISLHFAGGLLMCVQGQACFSWLKNALSLPNTTSVETDKIFFFACFSGLWLTLLLYKLKQLNKTQNLSVRISTCLFRSRVSLWSYSTSVLFQPGRYTHWLCWYLWIITSAFQSWFTADSDMLFCIFLQE